MALYMHKVTEGDPCIQDTRYPGEARNQDEVLFPKLPRCYNSLLSFLLSINSKPATDGCTMLLDDEEWMI